MEESEIAKHDYDVLASMLASNIDNNTVLRTIMDVLVWQQRQGMNNEQVKAHREWLMERLKLNRDVSTTCLIPLKK